MPEKNVNFEITANPAPYEAALARVVEVTTETVGEVKELFGSISETMGMLSGAFLALTAVFAGGEALKDFVEVSANAGFEASELGQKLGISATAASQLKVALDSSLISQDQYTGAVARVVRTLNTNEQAFTDLGVATRDSSGHLRSAVDIMEDVNTKLAQFKEGTDRNVEATRIYGKGWQDSVDILRLTKQAMDEAKERADALGLTVGAEGVQRSFAYKESMAEVHDVIEAVEKVIGDALLPVLTELGNWFSSIGPAVVDGFRATVEVLGVVFRAVWDIVVEVVSAIGDAFSTLGAEIEDIFGASGPGITWGEFFINVLRVVEVAVDAFVAAVATVLQSVLIPIDVVIDSFRLLADIVRDALTLKWSNIAADWNAGMQRIEDDVNRHVAGVANAVNKLGGQVDKALTGDIGTKPKETPIASPEGGGAGEGQGNPRQLQQLENQLEEKKALYEHDAAEHGQFLEFSKEMELKFWQDVLANTSLATDEKVQIERKMWTLEEQIAKESFSDQLASLKEQEKAAGAHYDEKLRIAEEYAEKVGAAYGLDSAQYKAAQQEVIAVDEQRKKQLQEIADIQEKSAQEAANAGLANEEAAAKQRVALGVETKQQLLEQEVTFENQRYELKLQSLQRMLELEKQGQDDPAALAKINAQIEALERQHQNTISQIQRQAQLERDKYWQQGADVIAQSFGRSVASMLNGTKTFAGAVRSLIGEMGDGLINIFVKMAEQWIEQELMKLIASQTTAESMVTAQAGIAGAAGTASWAGAPWPADIAAPAFGAQMAALAGSYAVAEQGYDVPAGVNPLTQLHAREMVLPADLADAVRGAAASGGKGNSYGPTSITNNFHRPMVSTDQIMSHITRAARNGHPAFRGR